MVDWDDFQATVRGTQLDWEFRTMTVRNYDSSLDGNGRRVADAATETTVDAEITRPRASSRGVSAAGQGADGDAEIWIRDDVGVTIRSMGTEDEIPTEIVDETTGITYEVRESFVEGNGLIRLEVDEK